MILSGFYRLARSVEQGWCGNLNVGRKARFRPWFGNQVNRIMTWMKDDKEKEEEEKK